MSDSVDHQVDAALGLVMDASATTQLASNIAIFDEMVRQQREIMALQREAYSDLLANAKREQETMIALLEKLGLTELREHAMPQFHGRGHVDHDPKDGFII